MLAEFGAIGALIAGYLIFRQLGMVFGWDDNVVYGLTAVATIGYGLYCKSLGRPLLIFMCIIMIPLATTELGTDGAISGLMEEPMKEAGYNGLWVLIYTSAIMMVLRFWFAGPIVEKLGPLGLFGNIRSFGYRRIVPFKYSIQDLLPSSSLLPCMDSEKHSSGRPHSVLFLSNARKVELLP